MARKLYSHQEEALEMVMEHLRSNNGALIVKASGLGKTILSAEIVRRFLGMGLRGMFICDKRYPIKQALNVYDQELDENLGIFTGSTKSPDFEQSDVLFASFQILVNKENRRQFKPDEFDFIIVDEAHHAMAPTYERVLRYFKPKYLIGMTATPDRSDDHDIRRLFGDIVVHITIADAIANGWLTPVDYRVMNDGLNVMQFRQILKQVYEEGEKFSMLQLNETIFIKERDEAIAEKILIHDMKTIIFCESILHAENFRKYIPGGKVLHSKIPEKRRDRILRDFREDKIQYLLVVDMLNEGIDIPNTEMVVFLRCTDSAIVFQQQLGRGLRKYPGKKKVLVLDFVANVNRLIAVKTLADEVIRKKGEFKEELDTTPTYIFGLNFTFEFSEEIVDVINLINYLSKRTYISDIPRLLAEYSPENELPANQVLAGTAKRLQWKCSKCGYEWLKSGNGRVAGGKGCPACAHQLNQRIDPGMSFASLYPRLAREYHSTKNKTTPERLSPTSRLNVWWRCRECHGEYQCTIQARIRRFSTCPTCGIQTAPSNPKKLVKVAD